MDTRAVIEPDPNSIHSHLDRVLASDQLARADTSRKLLTYLVDCCLRNEVPKETSIALDVFGKDASFSGAEHSIVRVSVRTLRQKLIEYYAGAGAADEIRFDIPKGGYKLVISRHAPEPAQQEPGQTVELNAPMPRRGMRRLAGAALAMMLLTSLLMNLYLWPRASEVDSEPAWSPVRGSSLWSDIANSRRPLTIVLGDLFMYSRFDAITGRMLSVRDPGINSSEELRIQMSSNPKFAVGRGQRQSTMLQKNVVIGMTTILSMLGDNDREIDVVASDDLTMDAVRDNDIIYLGPPVRLGLLVGNYESQSRYRLNAAETSITDIVTGKNHLAEGDLGERRVDYALAAKLRGPTGNNVVIMTSGARNAGILQIVRTLTSPEGVSRLEEMLHAQSVDGAGSFEALLSVTGFKRMDLAADLVDVSTLPRATTGSGEP